MALRASSHHPPGWDCCGLTSSTCFWKKLGSCCAPGAAGHAFLHGTSPCPEILGWLLLNSPFPYWPLGLFTFLWLGLNTTVRHFPATPESPGGEEGERSPRHEENEENTENTGGLLPAPAELCSSLLSRNKTTCVWHKLLWNPLRARGSPSRPSSGQSSTVPHGLQGGERGRAGGRRRRSLPHAHTTNSGTSSWVRSREKYLLVLLTGKASWMLMHCWARQPLQ